jgi:cobyrinic acid a,c-diamide synthase
MFDPVHCPVILMAPGRKLRGEGEELYVQGPVKASYFHAWFASSPQAAAGLFFKDMYD